MKITFEKSEEQLALIKAMASKNRQVAYEAQQTLAEFVGPVLDEVINQAPTFSNFFTTFSYDEDSDPSIPLDLYYDIDNEDYINVWSQVKPGGLATNVVAPVQSEMKFTEYTLDTAYAFDKKYAAKSRLDVVSKTFTRMAQEILLKQEKVSASLVMSALAGASTNGLQHVIRSTIANRFLLADLNALITRAKRINTAWTGGTPDRSMGRGITDLVVSPEIVEEIRNMAFNPVNTVNADGSAAGATDGIAAPTSLREKVFAAAGNLEFMGISLMEINEMGEGQRWNSLFDVKAGSTTFGGSAFDGADDQILVGLDLSRESLLRAVGTSNETGGQMSVMSDDQFVARQGKIGFYGSLKEGRMIVDQRTLVGLIV